MILRFCCFITILIGFRDKKGNLGKDAWERNANVKDRASSIWLECLPYKRRAEPWVSFETLKVIPGRKEGNRQ